MFKISKHKKRSILKVLVLSTIIRRGELHGYGIYRELTDMGMENWKPSIGSLYRTLHKLREEGLIEDKEIMTKNRRKIRVYKATDKGINEFIQIAQNFINKVEIGLSIILPTLSRLKSNNILKNQLSLLENTLRNINSIIVKYLH
ncbi:MAG: PadR family transcriptional regulator [Thermoprotei archaeon]